VTLIELLAVVSIMLIVTVIAVPAMKPALENRKIREAARAVNVFIGSARNHAIELGRPVGVLLLRDTSQGNPCITLQQVEIPAPYAGDVAVSMTPSAVGLCTGVAYVCGCPNVFTQGSQSYILTNSDGSIPYTVEMFFYPAINADLTKSTCMIEPGNTIQFGYQGPLYTIPPNKSTNPSTSTLLAPSIVTSTSSTQYTATFATINLPSNAAPNTKVPWPPSPSFTPPWPLPPNLGSPPSWPPTQYPQNFSDPPTTVPMTFQITRQPSPNTAATQSAVAPLQLPPGTVIDLPASGTNGYLWFGPAIQPGGTSPGPANAAMLVFSPAGGVYSVFGLGQWTQSGGNWNWVTQSGPLVDPIYFLIGRRDRMCTLNLNSNVAAPKLSGMGVSVASNGAQGELLPPDGLANWQDPQNLWVTVSPQTGRITTVENSVVNFNTLTNYCKPNTPSQADAIIAPVGARGIALQGQSKGGR
jgi:type II secretory pathway pseudopilin PulG